VSVTSADDGQQADEEALSHDEIWQQHHQEWQQHQQEMQKRQQLTRAVHAAIAATSGKGGGSQQQQQLPPLPPTLPSPSKQQQQQQQQYSPSGAAGNTAASPTGGVRLAHSARRSADRSAASPDPTQVGPVSRLSSSMCSLEELMQQQTPPRLQLPQNWGTDIRASGGGLAAFIRSYRLQLEQFLQEADGGQQQQQQEVPFGSSGAAGEQQEAAQALQQELAAAQAADAASPIAAAVAGDSNDAAANPAESVRSSLSHSGSSSLLHNIAPAGESPAQSAPAAGNAITPADSAVAAEPAADTSCAALVGAADALGEEASSVCDQQQQQAGGPTWGVDDYEEEFRQLSDQLQVSLIGRDKAWLITQP
jgi:hypothetical protein